MGCGLGAELSPSAVVSELAVSVPGRLKPVRIKRPIQFGLRPHSRPQAREWCLALEHWLGGRREPAVARHDGD